MQIETETIAEAIAVLKAHGYKVTAPRAAKAPAAAGWNEDRSKAPRDAPRERIDFVFCDGEVVKGQVLCVKGKFQIASACCAAIDRWRYRQRSLPKRKWAAGHRELKPRPRIESYAVPDFERITFVDLDIQIDVQEANRQTQMKREACVEHSIADAELLAEIA